MNGAIAVLKRELVGYFVTPVAYVFTIIFLVLTGVFTFHIGQFFERGQADLRPFFDFHPWLYLFLIPALAMRLWSEEHRSGTIELLLTLPLRPIEAVAGKFAAAWLFAGIALALTFPIWITVNVLGDPDNGAILTGYLGSFLMAGGFLAVGSCVSAATKSQVIAFVVTVVLCFGFLLAGFPLVLEFFSGWAPQFVLDTVSSFSFLTRFEAFAQGVVDLRDVLFFGALIGVAIAATSIIIELRKAA